jgi:hypothetical protein
MKVITLTPPWGTLMMLVATRPELGKHIETRSWATNYRGRLLIHQGSNLKPVGGIDGLRDLCNSEPFISALRAAGFGLGPIINIGALPMGKILGSVELVDCRATAGPRGEHGTGPKYADWVHALSSQERAFGNYAPGRYGWLCADARPLAEPIPARGYQGLWTYDGPLPTEAS